MKALILISIILCMACSTHWMYHFGPHRLDIVDSFRRNGQTYIVYGCVKDCPYRDTFPKPKYDEP